MAVLFSTPTIYKVSSSSRFVSSSIGMFCFGTKIIRINLLLSKALIASNTEKPIVKLLINRHNNKYSYTGASDDNILKNIELFDKLSLRFSNRVSKDIFGWFDVAWGIECCFCFQVLFIKDVIGSAEICCWSFYGHGKKITEVR